MLIWLGTYIDLHTCTYRYYSGAYTGTYQYRRKKYMSLDLYTIFTIKDWQSGRR